MDLKIIKIKNYYKKKKYYKKFNKKIKKFTFFKCKYFNKFIKYFMVQGKLDKADKIMFTVFTLLKEAYYLHGALFFYNLIILLKPAFIMTPIIRPFAGKRVMYLPYRMKALTKYKAALRIFMRYIKNISINKLILAHSIAFTITESLAVLNFDVDQHPLMLEKNKLMLDILKKKTFLHYRW
jgi:ribosomal protein S7